ncbi:hypothetical protein V8E52_007610 [Russula decolorans]
MTADRFHQYSEPGTQAAAATSATIMLELARTQRGPRPVRPTTANSKPPRQTWPIALRKSKVLRLNKNQSNAQGTRGATPEAAGGPVEEQHCLKEQLHLEKKSREEERHQREREEQVRLDEELSQQEQARLDREDPAKQERQQEEQILLDEN